MPAPAREGGREPAPGVRGSEGVADPSRKLDGGNLCCNVGRPARGAGFVREGIPRGGSGKNGTCDARVRSADSGVCARVVEERKDTEEPGRS